MNLNKIFTFTATTIVYTVIIGFFIFVGYGFYRAFTG